MGSIPANLVVESGNKYFTTRPGYRNLLEQRKWQQMLNLTQKMIYKLYTKKQYGTLDSVLVTKTICVSTSVRFLCCYQVLYLALVVNICVPTLYRLSYWHFWLESILAAFLLNSFTHLRHAYSYWSSKVQATFLRFGWRHDRQKDDAVLSVPAVNV